MEAKMYFSLDVEASGKTPAKSSMLSLGAYLVGTGETFYREIRPIHNPRDAGTYELDAIRVGCSQLECLRDGKKYARKEFDPSKKNPYFDPRAVLEEIIAKGERPEKAMFDFGEWVKDRTGKGPNPGRTKYRAVAAAAPASFDCSYVNVYFDLFHYDNPFGHTAEDINSLYRGLMENANAHIGQLKIGYKNPREHHALEDAKEQGKKMEYILAQFKAV
jgi:hypothetical protein